MNFKIYKILTPEQWQDALDTGEFAGAPVDLADGYIHFSTAEQVQETTAKHFVGAGPLVLVAFDPDTFGDALKWEPSRGGALFPHLYSTLDPSKSIGVHILGENTDGSHTFPEEY